MCFEHQSDDNLRIEAYAEPGNKIETVASSESLDDLAPVSTITINNTEAIMLAHALLEMVRRAREPKRKYTHFTTDRIEDAQLQHHNLVGNDK